MQEMIHFSGINAGRNNLICPFKKCSYLSHSMLTVCFSTCYATAHLFTSFPNSSPSSSAPGTTQERLSPAPWPLMVSAATLMTLDFPLQQSPTTPTIQWACTRHRSCREDREVICTLNKELTQNQYEKWVKVVCTLNKELNHTQISTAIEKVSKSKICG